MASERKMADDALHCDFTHYWALVNSEGVLLMVSNDLPRMRKALATFGDCSIQRRDGTYSDALREVGVSHSQTGVHQIPGPAMKAAHAKAKAMREAVVSYIKSNPGCVTRDVRAATGATKFQALNATRNGLIRKKYDGNRRDFILTYDPAVAFDAEE